MENKQVIEALKEVDALLEGHFLLSSGKHSNRYCQCAKLLQYPDKAAPVVKIIADKIKDIDFDIVVGPAMGGVVVAYELARQVGKPGIFAERVDGVMTIRRGFEITKGMKCIMSEDVVTTGKSFKEVAKVLEEMCIRDRLWIVNPGSVSLPRKGQNSLAIIDIEGDKITPSIMLID